MILFLSKLLYILYKEFVLYQTSYLRQTPLTILALTILYPFTLHLSYIINSADIGCHIHNCCNNHMFYADDLCVTAPSPSGFQALLNICSKFGF